MPAASRAAGIAMNLLHAWERLDLQEALTPRQNRRERFWTPPAAARPYGRGQDVRVNAMDGRERFSRESQPRLAVRQVPEWLAAARARWTNTRRLTCTKQRLNHWIRCVLDRKVAILVATLRVCAELQQQPDGFYVALGTREY